MKIGSVFRSFWLMLLLIIGLRRICVGGVNVWTSGGPVPDVIGVWVNPAEPSTIYAAAGASGLFRSMDNGVSWSSVPIDPANDPAAYAVVFDPVDPATLYVGSGDFTSPPRGAVLYKSTDAGKSWAAADVGLPRSGIDLMAVVASRPTTTYVVDGDLYSSIDGGQTWRISYLPTTYSSIGTVVRIEGVTGFAADRFNPMTIFLSNLGGRVPVASGVWRSIDGGITWTNLNTFRIARALNVGVDPKNTRKVFAVGWFGTISLSFDEGDQWTELASPCGRSVLFDPKDNRVIYCGGTGVFKSADSGVTWVPLGNGLPGLGVAALTSDPTGKILHAAVYGAGVFDYEIVDRPSITRPPRQNPSPRIVSDGARGAIYDR